MCVCERGGREIPSDRLLPLDRDGCQHFLFYYAILVAIFPIISVSLSLCLRPRLVITTFLSFDNKEEHGDR